MLGCQEGACFLPNDGFLASGTLNPKRRATLQITPDMHHLHLKPPSLPQSTRPHVAMGHKHRLGFRDKAPIASLNLL